jgi:hypothetical protein
VTEVTGREVAGGLGGRGSKGAPGTGLEVSMDGCSRRLSSKHRHRGSYLGANG